MAGIIEQITWRILRENLLLGVEPAIVLDVAAGCFGREHPPRRFDRHKVGPGPYGQRCCAGIEELAEPFQRGSPVAVVDGSPVKCADQLLIDLRVHAVLFRRSLPEKSPSDHRSSTKWWMTGPSAHESVPQPERLRAAGWKIASITKG